MKDTKNFDWLKRQPREYQISLFGEYAEMLKILATQLMEEEIENKCGNKYSRNEEYLRWTSNPGSIKVGEEKIPIEVPRYYDKSENTKRNVDIYRELKEKESPSETMIRSILLGFIQTNSENSTAVKGLLKNLLERNFRYEEGLLCILDGSKGLTKAVKDTFGNYCIIQRCQPARLCQSRRVA